MKIQAREKIILEPGFRRAYTPPAKESDLPVIREQESRLRNLKKRQTVKARQVRVRQEKAPTGMTEAELLRQLQAHGIGRPATYAGIVETLLWRAYVVVGEGGRLQVTARGREVCEYLVQSYPDIFSPTYTAQMERALDTIASGKRSYRAVLATFWQPLNKKRP